MSLLRRQEPCGDVTGAHDCRAFWRDVAPGAPNPKVAAGRRSNRSLLNSSPYDTLLIRTARSIQQRTELLPLRNRRLGPLAVPVASALP
jgi:hypothetical protein